MQKRILLTGISGFIGRNAARSLIRKNFRITALIRPQTDIQRIDEFKDNIEFFEIDLADIRGLKQFLDNEKFDAIIHIGALRPGRNYSQKDYFTVNVDATEQLMINAKNNDSKFIFCSSVGVFGAVPDQLPANEDTVRNADNYYHFTKIQAEKLIGKYILYGLQTVVIRPSITYGVGDFGFPFILTKLVDKKLLFLPDRELKIHLTDVNILAEIFVKFAEKDFPTGSTFNVADKEPVKMLDLVDFISLELRNKPYPKSRVISLKYFEIGEKIAEFLKNEKWSARFQLLSKSWYYETLDINKEFLLKSPETIPQFRKVIDWYKKK